MFCKTEIKGVGKRKGNFKEDNCWQDREKDKHCLGTGQKNEAQEMRYVENA